MLSQTSHSEFYVDKKTNLPHYYIRISDPGGEDFGNLWFNLRIYLSFWSTCFLAGIGFSDSFDIKKVRFNHEY